MSLTDKQREGRISEKGTPELSLEFDVFSDGSVSMWTHFNHGDDFLRVRRHLEAVVDHLSEFLKDEKMCPFRKATGDPHEFTERTGDTRRAAGHS